MSGLMRILGRGRRLVEIYALFLATKDPRVDRSAKIIAGLVIAYALLPMDVVPEFIPFAGVIDDLLLAWVGLSRVVTMIPDEVLNEHRSVAERAGRKVKWVLVALLVMVLLWIAAAVAGVVYIIRQVG